MAPIYHAAAHGFKRRKPSKPQKRKKPQKPCKPKIIQIDFQALQALGALQALERGIQDDSNPKHVLDLNHLEIKEKSIKSMVLTAWPDFDRAIHPTKKPPGKGRQKEVWPPGGG